MSSEDPDESVFASFGRTVRQIVAHVQEIIRSEVRLVRAELKEEVAGLKIAALFYAVTALCGFFAFAFFLLACVYGLSVFVEPWLAALVVAVGMGIMAGVAFLVARKELQRVSRRAEQTIESAKENVKWAKNRFK